MRATSHGASLSGNVDAVVQLVSSGVAAAAGLDEGAYVTDGARLYRVVQRLDPLRCTAAAALEDCLTIEVRSYAAADLWEMGLRLVRPPSNCAVERPIRC